MELLVDPAAKPVIRHPAKYTDSLLPVFARMLRPHVLSCSYSYDVLDPFAGTGKVHLLSKMLPIHTYGVEIEPEWSAMHQKTQQGNALNLPWPDSHFDAVVTSPTYGNRMADHHVAKDGSQRNTYTHAIGRKLHDCNSGQMQWGSNYREFHIAAWTEARRVLKRGGIFILNIKDHIRTGKRMHVTDWHIETICAIGFKMIEHKKVNCPGNGYGQNGNARIPYESVVKFVSEKS